MEKHFINPPALPAWEQAFSQIVSVTGGPSKTIYLSGQVSVDRDNRVIGVRDLKAQADQAFENIKIALSAVGATPEDVVKLTIYIKGYNQNSASLVGDAFRRVFQHKNLPASTWVGVQSLALDDLLIEVDVIAVLAA